MNDFERDDKYQRKLRNRILGPGFYAPIFKRYVFLDKGRLALTLQKQFAIDTIAQGKGGVVYCFEEKIVRWPKKSGPKKGEPYTAYALETMSCTVPGREKDDWMRYGQADYLLYAFEQEDGSLIVHVIDFPQLKAWFWQHVEDFAPFGPLETLNRSAGKVVPIAAVRTAVPSRVQQLWKPKKRSRFDPLQFDLFGDEP